MNKRRKLGHSDREHSARKFINNISEKLLHLQDFYDKNLEILSKFISMADLQQVLESIVELGSETIAQYKQSEHLYLLLHNVTKCFSIIQYPHKKFALVLDTFSTALYHPISNPNYAQGTTKVVTSMLNLTGNTVTLVAKFVIDAKTQSKDINQILTKAAMAEIEISQKLHHPNLIQYYLASCDEHNIGEQNYFAHITFHAEYFNYNLKAYLQTICGYNLEDKNKQIPNLLNALFNLLDAITYFHSQGSVHQDIKPENILFNDFSRFVLADYGLTQQHQKELIPSTTPRYESPEIYKIHKIVHNHGIDSNYKNFVQSVSIGRVYNKAYDIEPLRSLNYCTDVWSLGVITHEILTDQEEYSAKTPIVIAKSPFLEQLLNPDYRKRISAQQARDNFLQSGEEELTALLQKKHANQLF